MLRVLYQRYESFHFGTTVRFCRRASDSVRMRQAASHVETTNASAIPWAIQIRAISFEEPGGLLQVLTDTIVGCGGWILARGASDSGSVNLLFEFERRACVDMYAGLIAVGVDLSRSGHIRFTELCQCSLSGPKDRGADVASIDLEVQTLSAGNGGSSDASLAD